MKTHSNKTRYLFPGLLIIFTQFLILNRVNAQCPPAPTATAVQNLNCTVPVVWGSVTVTNPTSGLTYKLTYGTGGTPVTNTTGLFDMLYNPGTYYITATNSAGCTSPATSVYLVLVNRPSATLTAFTCSPPTATIIVGDQGSGISYSIDNGATYQSSNIFPNVPAGVTYWIQAKSNVCTSLLYQMPVPQGKPAAPAYFTNQPTCAVSTGAINVNLLGNGYSYSIDGINYSTSNIFPFLAPGTYKVSTKINNCISDEVTVNIVAAQSTVAASSTITNVPCGGTTGTATINATAGSAPYNYSINGGTTYQSSNVFNLPQGNHTVRVKDNGGCTKDISFTINQNTTPNLVITSPAPLCSPLSVNLTSAAITPGSEPGLTYTYWANAAATTSLVNPSAVTVSGTYYIKATLGSCSVTKPVDVKINPTTLATRYADVYVVYNQPHTLSARTFGQKYLWLPATDLSNNTISNPVITTRTGNEYKIEITDNAGCITVDTQLVKLSQVNVLVPRAFTPDGNNVNDILRPILYNITTLVYFKVYNPAGQLVYQTNKIGEGWDGKLNGILQPTDTYPWTIQCIDIYGNVINRSGLSVLIR